MKTLNIVKYTFTCMILFVAAACSDFEEINKDPSTTDVDKVKAEYLLNQSVIDAQQDPHIAERMFVLTWKRASRFEWGGGMTIGGDNNGWITDYLGNSYGVKWLNAANQAVDIGTEHIETGISQSHTANVVQIARIWRAYLNAELTSGFGPIPALDFGSEQPQYDSEKDIFYFILQELKEAEAALDPSVDMAPMANQDAFYAGKITAWKKYANSLRMRYAMQLSEVDNAKAKTEFEDAVKGGATTLISTKDDIAAVKEVDGWNALSGVMSRPWNAQMITATLNNLVVGLGGQDFDVPAELQASLKNPAQYLGQLVDRHFPLTTNDPCAGYYFDGIPSKIDPRATVLFNIPGYNDGVIFFDDGSPLATTANLLDPADNTKVQVVLTTKYSWSAWVSGVWDVKGGLSANLVDETKNYPRLSKVYRQSTNKRVWFGNWETWFLLAEAAHYGWNTGGGTIKEYYENGVKASFEYLGLTNADAYLASNDYNRVGTSVNIDHITEAQPFNINYVNAYTNQAGTVQYRYPVNSIHNGGTTNNDVLTKIITQKYLAFVPWNPLEAWNDQRRLGLPFMENQAVEKEYTNLQVPLTPANSKECRLEFYPKRYRYPAGLQTTNKAGYDQALQKLGGADKSTTPLWWNMK